MRWNGELDTPLQSIIWLYCWGGQQKGLPMIHYNDEKRKFTSFVDIFHLPTLKWESRSTTTTPPAGVMGYACSNTSDNILYFGGFTIDETGFCRINYLLLLSISQNTIVSCWVFIKQIPQFCIVVFVFFSFVIYYFYHSWSLVLFSVVFSTFLILWFHFIIIITCGSFHVKSTQK